MGVKTMLIGLAIELIVSSIILVTASVLGVSWYFQIPLMIVMIVIIGMWVYVWRISK